VNSSHDSCTDRSPERRPATPHHASKDKVLRRSKDLSRAQPGDVSLFLVNFLAHRVIKARTVLKEADLNPDNLHDAFAVRALFEAAEPYLPETIVTDTDSSGTDCWSDSPTLKRRLPLSLVLEVSCLCGLLFSFLSLSISCGSVQGWFSCFSISFRFREVSHVEGSSLTTSICYQTYVFYEISKPKVG
jgi:hypothetical protein